MPRVPRAVPPILAAVLLLGLSSGLFNATLGLKGGQGVALGILLAALVLWVSEAVPLFVTGIGVGLLGAVWLAPALGVPPETFVAPFASDVILLFLGGFVLSSVLEEHGLAERLARAVLARVGTESDRVLLGVLLTTAGLSMWMSNTAASALMLALLGALLPAIDKDDPLRKAVVISVAAGANLGGLGTPIGSPPNAVAIASLDAAATPTFAGWLLRALPVLCLTLYGTWRLLLAWFPPRAATVNLPTEVPEWTTPARWGAGLTALTVLLWLTTGLHPLSLGTVGLVPVMVAYGGRLLPAKHVRTLPWDVLLLVGGGLCLGAVVSRSGLDAWILGLLPLESVGAVGTLVALAIVGAGLSVFMSNTAAATLMIPLALAVPNMPPLITAMAVAFACSTGMALPVSTPPNTMVFGLEIVDNRTFVKAGSAIMAMGLAATLLIGVPWWALIAWVVG